MAVRDKARSERCKRKENGDAPIVSHELLLDLSQRKNKYEKVTRGNSLLGKVTGLHA
jgi:hypothetical protein